MDTISAFTLPGILLLLTLVFGVWLGLSGKPYSGLLFNVHKLVALGAVVVAAFRIYRAFQITGVQAILIVLIAVAATCAVTLFATGALMSLGKPAYRLLRAVHSLASILAVLTLAAAISLLTG